MSSANQGILGVVARHEVGRRAVLRAVPAAMAHMFDPGAARGLSATLELTVTDPQRRRGARYALRIDDGRLFIDRGGEPEAQARVHVAADDLLRLASGAVRWPELLGEGRLQMAGDPFLALRFPALFGLRAG